MKENLHESLCRTRVRLLFRLENIAEPIHCTVKSFAFCGGRLEDLKRSILEGVES